MKYKLWVIISAIAITGFISSCQSKETDQQKITLKNEVELAVKKDSARSKVMTAEEQKALTPDMVIQRLKDGNKLFLANDVTQRNHSALVRDGIQGQFPMAVILACMDSRVPVEDVFDCAAGDLFVCRVAGNVVNGDILGSLEYGCKVSGSKLIVVMGHRYCGAIKSAVKDVKLGNITPLLAKMKPAVTQAANFDGEKIYSNEKYLTQVAINNVKNVTAEITKKSPILKEMVDKGELKIIGAGYDLNNGALIFFDK
jgi:carbonic anhydrase